MKGHRSTRPKANEIKSICVNSGYKHPLGFPQMFDLQTQSPNVKTTWPRNRSHFSLATKTRSCICSALSSETDTLWDLSQAARCCTSPSPSLVPRRGCCLLVDRGNAPQSPSFLGVSAESPGTRFSFIFQENTVSYNNCANSFLELLWLKCHH